MHGGLALRQLRTVLGVSMRELADIADVDMVHLIGAESRHVAPSQELADAIRNATGIDLYVFTWLEFGDIARLPESLRPAAHDLYEKWDAEFKEKVAAFKAKHFKP
jgi:transcriptional regulator with XRE-family HTH domain